MDRRIFLKLCGLTVVSSPLIGCDKTPSDSQYSNIVMPEFSAARLHSKLDKLLKAYESKGMNVSSSLLPAISEANIREQCSWFPFELPEEIIALYTWRGGVKEDAVDSKHPFMFRDNVFCSLATAKKEYLSIMKYYGHYPEDHLMLKYSFPLATFQGSSDVLPANNHQFNPSLKRPIINVHEGIYVSYYTIESMVDICIDWINHPSYDTETHSLPRTQEMKVWQKHNIGIFT